MEALGRTAILLFSYVFAGYTEQVLACQQAPSTFKNIWYIDPVNGKTPANGGNGSQAHPWNSLDAVANVPTGYTYPLLTTAPYTYAKVFGPNSWAYVFAPGPKGGPIAPGDEILLMSGNYGNVHICVYNTEISNSSFVTVAAAPGQTPVLSSLVLCSTNMWAFRGLRCKVSRAPTAALWSGSRIRARPFRHPMSYSRT